MYDEVKMISTTYGGPAQYLVHLWEAFPERDDLFYQRAPQIAAVKEKDLGAVLPVVMHIAGLGFHGDCSLKPPPGTILSQQLAEQILTDGFCTSGEPLLVCQSRDRITEVTRLGQQGTLPVFLPSASRM